MSHTTRIKTVPIRSVSALRKAAEALNRRGIRCELVENQRPRMYSANQSEKLPYVLRLKDCVYDVGFTLETDGTLTPVVDKWRDYIKRMIGTDAKGSASHIGQLMREYSKEVVLEDAEDQGYMIESCELGDNGQYQIELSV